jgi:hypothetical protein
LIRYRLVGTADNGSSSHQGPCVLTESLAWLATVTRF